MGHHMVSLKHRKGHRLPDVLHPLVQWLVAQDLLGQSVKPDITLHRTMAGDLGCRFRHHLLVHPLHSQ